VPADDREVGVVSKPVALVTGASRGIGAATAKLAAQRGYAVAINFHSDGDAAAQVAQEIERGGGSAIAVQADVSVESEVLELFGHIDTKLGLVRALVNNAGIVAGQARLDEMSAQRLQRIFAVNILGAFLCSREAVRRMSTLHGGGGGAIVNVSSAAARLGSPGEYVDYAASKGALDTLTIGLAKEVAAEGVRVAAVRPGIIHTEIHASGGEPNRIERLRTSIPAQRGGQPGEVARAILWLLSDEASYANGAILDFAGGR
jgi:NAD(P)-dependent dehydrogenase (short-subunit alcohol dehydrogenase family)